MRALGAAALLALLITAPAWGADPVRVLVDDVPLVLSPAPARQGATLFVPLRPLAQHFQAAVVAGRQTVEVRLPDGTDYRLRLGRLEIWSGEIVIAVAEAPVQVIQGTTMIPRGAVDVLFGTLTVWNPQDGVLTITTARPPDPVAAPPRPAAPASRAGGAARAAAVFVPEFRPASGRVVVASGYAAAGLALGAQTTGTARLQFRTHTGPEHLDGSAAVSASPSAVTGSGTITRRTASDSLTIGGISINDSPLTVYEQPLLGALYEVRGGGAALRLFGGSIPGSGAHLYGITAALEPVGAWLLQGASVYDPATGAVIVKARAARPLRDGLTAFAETARGSAPAGGGTAWRVGMEAGRGALGGSLSFLSLGPGFPAVGNSALFASRSGPLLSLTYRPSPQWTLSGSASLLRGTAGVSDRSVTSVLVHYRPAPSVAIVGETRMVEDTAGGVLTRSTAAQLALVLTRGPWGFVLAGSATEDAGVLTGTAGATTAFSARAGYTLRGGLPVWVEVSRSLGDTAAWAYGAGTAVRVSGRTTLNAQVRHKIYTLPSAYADTAVELSFSQPLASGATLTLGGGVQYVTTAPAATPYLAFQYGIPLYAYGPPQTGRVAAVMYVDRNGSGTREPDEPGVGGIVLRVNQKSAAISDGEGAASVDGVRAGDVTVAVDGDTIPAHLVAVAPVQTLRVEAARTAPVSFALAPAAAVVGVVFHDENGNGVRDGGERAVPGVVLQLAGADLLRTADGAGVYVFDHLAAGAYAVTIDPRSLPLGFRIRGTGAYPVTVRAGEEQSLDVPLDGRPVIRTF